MKKGVIPEEGRHNRMHGKSNGRKGKELTSSVQSKGRRGRNPGGRRGVGFNLGLKKLGKEDWLNQKMSTVDTRSTKGTHQPRNTDRLNQTFHKGEITKAT